MVALLLPQYALYFYGLHTPVLIYAHFSGASNPFPSSVSTFFSILLKLCKGCIINASGMNFMMSNECR